MILVIDRNEILNNQLINTNDIDGVLRKREAMGSSPDPNEIILVPIVLYSLYLTIKEIDKVFINSIKISGKDIKFIHTHATFSTDKNHIFISLADIDFCDDIVINYNTRQDLRENKINELVK
jgi:hypothetical protein